MKFESEAHKAAFMELMSHAKRANQAPRLSLGTNPTSRPIIRCCPG